MDEQNGIGVVFVLAYALGWSLAHSLYCHMLK